MTHNNTETLTTAQKYYKLAEVDMSRKRAIGASALQLMNKGVGGVTDIKPVFYENVYQDIKMVASATIPTGTFNRTAGGDLTSSVDTGYLIKGDLLGYEGNIYEVLAIKNTNTITIKLLFGTDKEIPEGAELLLKSNAVKEGNTGVEDRKMQLERQNYNYTQIVTGQASMTGSVAVMKGLSGENLLLELQKQAIKDFTKKLQSVVTSPFRHKRKVVNALGREEITRFAGGILFFTRNKFDEKGEVTGTREDNIITVNGPLEKKHINQAFVKVGNKGTLNTIAGTYADIASLADIESAKVQIINKNGSTAEVVGGGIQKFKAPVEVDGNQITHFVITDELPTGTALVYNKNAVTIEQLKGRALVKYKPANDNDDNHRLFFRDEVTVCVKEAEESFIYLEEIKNS